MNTTINPSALRDLRAMARRGETFEYVRDVFQWPPERLRQICIVNSVTLPGMPVGEVEKAPAHDRYAAQRLPRPYLRKPQDVVLSETIGVATSVPIKAAVEKEASRRRLPKSRIVHAILAAVDRRNLWADLLDGSAP